MSVGREAVSVVDCKSAKEFSLREPMLQKILKAASWLVLAGLVITTIVPADERVVTGLQHHVEHFIAFGLAGLTFGLAYAGRWRLLVASAVAFALALELAQIPLSTRHARLEDFIVDAVAGCVGILIAHVCRNRAGKREEGSRRV